MCWCLSSVIILKEMCYIEKVIKVYSIVDFLSDYLTKCRPV